MATAQQVSRQPGKTLSGGVVRINLAGTRYPVGKENIDAHNQPLLLTFYTCSKGRCDGARNYRLR